MRKLVLIILLILFVLPIVGCNRERYDEHIPDWGVELTTTQITPTGLTLVCHQSGGNQTDDLLTLDSYVLEVHRDNEWIPVEILSIESWNMFWKEEQYILPMNDKIEWQLNWEQIYGELPTDSYRIVKRISGHTGEGLQISETSYETDFHVLTYYAYFEIEV